MIQRVLEHCSVEKVGTTLSCCHDLFVVVACLEFFQKAPILDEVLTVIDDLIRDQYGNYVIQHVLSSGRASDVSAVVEFLSGDMLALSQHKFASNVVERCLEHCNAVVCDPFIPGVFSSPRSLGNEGIFAPIAGT